MGSLKLDFFLVGSAVLVPLGGFNTVALGVGESSPVTIMDFLIRGCGGDISITFVSGRTVGISVVSSVGSAVKI